MTQKIERAQLALPQTPRYHAAMSRAITTYNETELHAALKRWAAGPDDRFEVEVDGYVVDVVTAGGRLVEIQTGSFGSIRRKLQALCRHHHVHLIYPIAARKWILRRDPEGEGFLSRRRSPRHGTVTDLFYELVRMPALLAEPNLSLEVVLVEEEEIRRYARTRRRRRLRWISDERRLLQVLQSHHFRTPADLAALLPLDLPEPFTTADLARELAVRRPLAQKMAYCLRELTLLEVVGKEGNSLLYRPVRS